MWRYDMGWAIESGTWYAPYIAFDVDGDGYAEVYTKAGEGDPREPYGAVVEGPEYLVKIDGRTGEAVKKVDWLNRDGFSVYNRYSRNYLAIAYLNGEDPSIVISRGTYDMIKTAAYDKNLAQSWYWETTGDNEDYRGQAEHGLTAADVDDDGRDELILGAAALDDDGKGLWTTGTGHGNVCKVGDIDPVHPGLEIYKGRETKTEAAKGLCLVSALDGKDLWCYDKPAQMGVSSGMIGDFDPASPGMECYAISNDLDRIWFYAADGRSLPAKNIKTKDVQPVWWDADQQKEIVQQAQVLKFGGDALLDIEGKVIAIADVIGDWREEIITAMEGELRIYSTTTAADTAKICLMQDGLYRNNVAAFFSMGYLRAPQLGGYSLPRTPRIQE